MFFFFFFCFKFLCLIFFGKPQGGFLGPPVPYGSVGGCFCTQNNVDISYPGGRAKVHREGIHGPQSPEYYRKGPTLRRSIMSHPTKLLTLAINNQAR